jgi:rhodanese-related sulfurtransferase
VDTVIPARSISRTELAALLGRADAPLILDVRPSPRFAQSDRLLATAQRCAPEHIAHFAAGGTPRQVVVYCVYGHEVGKNAAQALAQAGWDARSLAGGIEGGETGVDAPGDVAAWREQPLPVIRKRPDLGVTGEQPSRWITRERPKIDRIACPWLVRRFIDPRAEFFYVPTERVVDEARRLAAVPYDIADAPITHVWERCSFDALIDAFGLREPALDALATIVRGADTDRVALAPPSAGLLAFSLGLSRLHADDHDMLAAALPLYDALYEWCRAAQGERHSWSAHTVSVVAE